MTLPALGCFPFGDTSIILCYLLNVKKERRLRRCVIKWKAPLVRLSLSLPRIIDLHSVIIKHERKISPISLSFICLVSSTFFLLDSFSLSLFETCSIWNVKCMYINTIIQILKIILLDYQNELLECQNFLQYRSSSSSFLYNYFDRATKLFSSSNYIFRYFSKTVPSVYHFHAHTIVHLLKKKKNVDCRLIIRFNVRFGLFVKLFTVQ